MAIEEERETIRRVQRRAALETQMDDLNYSAPDPLGFKRMNEQTTGLEKAIEEILKERGRTHGDFTNHAGCTQELKNCVHKWLGQSGKSWRELPYETREALDMILHKIGRVVAGDAMHADHWNDIAGYAKLVSQELAKPKHVPGGVNYVTKPPLNDGANYYAKQDDDDGA